MTYKDAVVGEMNWLAKQKDTIFIGEGVINAGRVYGTLDDVPIKKCIEMPVAENLIVGCAIGLAIRKYKPIVIFNFMDFMLPATSMIIHQLAGIPELSNGKVRLPVIIRAIAGRKGSRFEYGCQHDNDFSLVFSTYIETRYFSKSMGYQEAYALDKPILIVEEKDKYEKDISAH